MERRDRPCAGVEGGRQVRGEVIEWLRDNPEPVSVTRATVDLGVDAAAVREALDTLVEDGRLIDTETDGKYDLNR